MPSKAVIVAADGLHAGTKCAEFGMRAGEGLGDLPVYLMGDANGDRPILHEPADEGHIAGLKATSEQPIRMPRRTSLGIVFNDPGAVVVGRRAADRAASFASQGRARTMQRNSGLLRIYAARTDEQILGAEMAAPAAEHTAHLVALVAARGSPCTIS
jgi:dihydrolipoamide dehydrogenase